MHFENRLTWSSLFFLVAVAFTIQKASAAKVEKGNDDDDDFELPSFTLNPIVDLLNKEEVPKETENGTYDDSKAVLDPVGLSSLYTKFLKPPTGSRAIPANATHEEVYIHISHLLDEEIEIIIKDVLPFAFEYQQDRVNVSAPCANSMLNLGSALKSKTSWAFKFLDAMGGIPSGILEGTLSDFGNFDQCLDAQVTSDEHYIGVAPIRFQGTYCLAELEPPLPQLTNRLTYETVVLNYTKTELENTFFDRWSTYVHDYYSYPISIGACVPSTCKPEEIQKAIQNVARNYNMTVKVSSRCQRKEDSSNMDHLPMIPLEIVLLLSFLVILATTSECFSSKTDNPKETLWQKLVKSFSLVSNSEKLFASKEETSSEDKVERTLAPTNGIRVLLLVWLIIGDVYLLGGLEIGNLIKNSYTDFKLRGANVGFQVIINSWNLVSEAFFFLSGLTISLMTLKALSENNKLSAFRFVFHKWINLVPSVIGTILLAFIFFNPYFGSGPLFAKHSASIAETCENNWWANVFFLSNWFPVDKMCLRHTWFLSALFQLHVLALFVLLALHKTPTLGVIMSGLFILSGIIVPGFVTFMYKLPPTFIFNNPYITQVKEDLAYNFFPTFNHFSTYFLGIVIGYAIIKGNEDKSRNKILETLSGVISIALSLLTLFITYKWNELKNYPNATTSVLYSALFRVSWISGIAWFTCFIAQNQEGVITKLLSSNFFNVLRKLSLQLFLNHSLVIWYYYLTQRNLITYKDMDLLMISSGTTLITLILSLFTYFVFEAPFRSIYSALSSFQVTTFLNEGITQQTVTSNGVVNPAMQV